jgi:hypothetical protein
MFGKGYVIYAFSLDPDDLGERYLTWWDKET